MLRCLIALTTLLPAVALSATIWTWIDERGQRHYSDVEVPGATAIEIEGAQTFSGGVPAVAPAAPQPAAGPVAVRYSALEILSPSADETVRNIEGSLSVSVGTVPQLAAGHFIDVSLDGQRQQLNVRSLDLTVSDVFRGTHTLQALIVDGTGAVLMQSAPVTFFVQQASSLRPPAGALPRPPGQTPNRPPAPNPGGN